MSSLLNRPKLEKFIFVVELSARFLVWIICPKGDRQCIELHSRDFDMNLSLDFEILFELLKKVIEPFKVNLNIME